MFPGACLRRFSLLICASYTQELIQTVVSSLFIKSFWFSFLVFCMLLLRCFVYCLSSKDSFFQSNNRKILMGYWVLVILFFYRILNWYRWCVRAFVRVWLLASLKTGTFCLSILDLCLCFLIFCVHYPEIYCPMIRQFLIWAYCLFTILKYI